ncbi:hypothetical protein M422DRAFT_67024 [Sphaerobolus stellatus SS14]|uniref:Dilute domain-containing protein n=1 Tax=Sphaerobolus stellatus (strain SS14) TaxID=990650 RepID=A0A0C9W1T9_SPHS4|nr:hypothetical protein M422DRAFT_67024 [Sphaerobolus stellatus SS14]
MAAAMASSPLPDAVFTPEPDLYPLYPTPLYLDPLLAPDSGLSPPQKLQLVQHSLNRACTFADINLLTFLLADPHARSHIDLGVEDEDAMGFVTLTILGFGAELERDVEREECVRLLVNEGADVNAPDHAGWTALHHAALLSPPTLVSFLLTHGCSPLTRTRRGLTPLDILTAHSPIPGRESVALLLEEAMREQGWIGGRMELRRRETELRQRRLDKRKAVKQQVGRVLGLDNQWWGDQVEESDDDSEGDDVDNDDSGPMGMPYSPPLSFTNMLVFSPSTLSDILDSITYRATPTLRCSEPARSLYLLARFACLTCDDTWLEDLMGGAFDRIERLVFAKPDDIMLQSFWLYNTTALLHFLRCDNTVAEICDLLDLFSLLEGVIRAIYVFIIRIAERKMDPLLDTALLDHAPISSEFDNIHFEDEWSIFRPFASSGTKLKKKQQHETAPSAGTSGASASLRSPSSSSRPPSPALGSQNSGAPPSARFSWTQSLTRSKAASVSPNSLLNPDSSSPSPNSITALLEALHTLLTLAGVNPATVTQIFSQVLYWSSCELFNRILTRKKYICRSRAVQIGMNVSVLEEWVVSSGLPHGVESHFTPVRELLHWLQCLSSISEFTALVETIQTMKSLNPLQMRRAVRDYRYEVSETRMSEECSQYLIQLQKDWERRRVRLGVEALRREMGDKDYDREGSVASTINEVPEDVSQTPSLSGSTQSSQLTRAQRGIDLLFSRDYERAEWEAPQPPEALGELRDSRHMLPLVFPSNPRLLAAVQRNTEAVDGSGRKSKRESLQTPNGHLATVNFLEREKERPASRASVSRKGALAWTSRAQKLRTIGIETLEWVDGVRGQGRWAGVGHIPPSEDEDEEQEQEEARDKLRANGDAKVAGSTLSAKPQRRRSLKRPLESEGSIGGETAVLGDD